MAIAEEITLTGGGPKKQKKRFPLSQQKESEFVNTRRMARIAWFLEKERTNLMSILISRLKTRVLSLLGLQERQEKDRRCRFVCLGGK